MRQLSPQKKYQTKINLSGFDRSPLQSSLVALSSAVGIENMIKKKSVFMPTYDEIRHDYTGKYSLNRSTLKYKKQIEPHKAKSSNSIIERAKLNLSKEPISSSKSPIRKSVQGFPPQKKMSGKNRTPDISMTPPTASFYVRKGDKPIHLELKMDIKQVESVARPSELIEDADPHKKSLKFHRRRNFLRFANTEIKRADSALTNYEAVNTLSYGCSQDLALQRNGKDLQKRGPSENPSQKNLRSALDSNTQSLARYDRDRYAKSNAGSYIKKDKIRLNPISDEHAWVSHVKKVVQNPQKCDEMLVSVVQAQAFLCEQHCLMSSRQSLLEGFSAECLQVGLWSHQKHQFESIFSRGTKKQVQIASITKVMTAFLVIKIAAFFRLDIRKEKQRASKRASTMPGTSAELMYSDTLTIYQLLHGLMLPSGNDAAVCLADWGGKMIRKYCLLGQKYLKSKETTDCRGASSLSDAAAMDKRTFQKLFIFHMNKTANTLGLLKTNFANTHGLMSSKAHSTAHDVAKLTCIAMGHPIFAEIVGKKQFDCKVYNRTYGQERRCYWKNTNKLLNFQGFVGVKTGVTPSAGPCLSSMFRLNERQSLVIVVLKVKSMQNRFKESLELLRLAIESIDSIRYKKILGELASQLTRSSTKQSQQQALIEATAGQDQTASENEDNDSEEEILEIQSLKKLQAD